MLSLKLEQLVSELSRTVQIKKSFFLFGAGKLSFFVSLLLFLLFFFLLYDQ